MFKTKRISLGCSWIDDEIYYDYYLNYGKYWIDVNGYIYLEKDFDFDINTKGDESNYVTESMKRVYNYLENQTLENYEKLYKYQKQHLISEGIPTPFKINLFGKIVNKFKKFIN